MSLIKPIRHGALTPLMCVDKAPDAKADFDALVAESRRTGPPWQVVVAAGLSAFDGRPSTQSQTDPALKKIVSAVRLGAVSQFAAYNRAGDPIQIDGPKFFR